MAHGVHRHWWEAGDRYRTRSVAACEIRFARLCHLIVIVHHSRVDGRLRASYYDFSGAPMSGPDSHPVSTTWLRLRQRQLNFLRKS